MRFQIDQTLLSQVRQVFERHKRLYWIIGGAGSGKSTLARALAQKTGMPVYDMDAHIYGDYHARFRPDRHPVNWAWATADHGLAWLLARTWDEFNSFNQAALPEYLDLLARDLDAVDPEIGIFIDGGICNPALLAQAIPVRQIVCLAGPARSSMDIWEADEERRAMKGYIQQLPDGEAAWRRFLDFDEQITKTILRESSESGIAICARNEAEGVDHLAQRVASTLDIC